MLVDSTNQLTLLLEVAQSDKVWDHHRISINKTKMLEQLLQKQKIVSVLSNKLANLEKIKSKTNS